MFFYLNVFKLKYLTNSLRCTILQNIITVRKRCCRKLMFSQACVSHSDHKRACLPTMPWGRQTPYIGRPHRQIHLYRQTPSSISGRYASYWNASVLLQLIHVFGVKGQLMNYFGVKCNGEVIQTETIYSLNGELNRDIWHSG